MITIERTSVADNLVYNGANYPTGEAILEIKLFGYTVYKVVEQYENTVSKLSDYPEITVVKPMKNEKTEE